MARRQTPGAERARVERHALFGDALRQYRRAAGLTQEELAEKARLSTKAISALERGVNRAPRKETLTLLAKALRLSARERAALAAATIPAPSATSAPPSLTGSASRFVGRATELALLDRHLRYATPPALLVAGEPGIGKTRLLSEAAQRAQERGFTVVFGRCHRTSAHDPFAPLPAAIDCYLDGLAAPAASAALQGCSWLARLMPELVEEGLLAAPPAALTAEQERRLMFRAIARFLANIAGPEGTLLVLDDLHWAGSDALDLLLSLAEPTNTDRLRVLVGHRTRDAHAQAAVWDTLADLARAGLAISVELRPFVAAEADELLRALLQGRRDAAYMRALFQRTGGVPFFLVSCALDHNARGGEHDVQSEEQSVPWSVAQSVRQRVASLPGQAPLVLEAAAVVGWRASLDVLSAIGQHLRLAAEDVRGALDAACQERLLLDRGESYQFAHDLIREALEADLRPGQRALLHRWTAEALERGPIPPPPATLARHYALAGEQEKADVYLEQAGDRALALHANAEAARAFRELAMHLSARGDASHAADARKKLGMALMAAAHYGEALEALDLAASYYQTQGDMERLAEVMATIGETHALEGTSEAGIARLRAAMDASATPALSERALASLHLSLAWLINTTGRYTEALLAAEQATRLAEAAQDTTLRVQANLRRGHLQLMLLHLDEGIGALREVIPLAEANGDLRSLRFALNSLGWIHELRGEFEADSAYTERAFAVAEQLGDPTVLAFMWSNRGGPPFNQGNWPQARAYYEQGIELMRQVGGSWAAAWPPLLLGQLCLAEGRSESGLALLAEALVLAEHNKDLQAMRWAQGALAEWELLQGRPEAALERLEPLLDRPGLREIDVTALLPQVAWAYTATGRVERATEMVAETIWRAETEHMLPTLVRALCVQSIIASDRGCASDARRDVAWALELSQSMRHPYLEAKILHWYGLFEAREGAQAAARERLEAALAILSRLGERPYASQVERALAKLLAPASQRLRGE